MSLSAGSVHTDPEQLKEYEVSEDEVRQLARDVATSIRQSQHVIAFTGAGISTSAGIPDFRGPQGVWTLQAQGKSRTAPAVSNIKALPTPTHMALVALAEAGILKCLISQSIDGLCRKSGFPPHLLAELHGNSNLEACPRCHLDYLRDFHVRRRSNAVHDHVTDRKCAQCGGLLYDTIINFGENLPSEPQNMGFEHSNLADLCLVLGCSLVVSPANQMPQLVAQRDKTLVVCNLQKTPLDDLVKFRIFAKTDIFMMHLMNELQIPIPEWRLRRRIRAQLLPETGKLTIFAVDHNDQLASFFQSVEVYTSTRKLTSNQEPHQFSLDTDVLDHLDAMRVTLNFFGHYQEPPYQFKLSDLVALNEQKQQIDVNFVISFKPGEQAWVLDGVQVS